MISKMRLAYLHILLGSLLVLYSIQAQAQEPTPIDPKTPFGIKSNDTYRILSPLPGSTVKSGDLYVCVQLAPNLELNENSVKIFLDNRIITNFVKIQNHKVTMLYLLKLRPGKHTLGLEAKEKGYDWLKPQEWSFFVEEQVDPIQDSINKAVRRQVELTGSVISDYRRTILKGSDYALSFRQEPSYTAQLNMDVNLRVGKVNFPFRMFRTSDEITYNVKGLLSRNYFMAGINTGKFEAYYGDVNPVFDKLVLTGTRVHGTKVALNFKYFQMQAIYGYVNRAIEGSETKYTINEGFPQGSLRIDSATKDTFTRINGFYRRDIAALRLHFGNKLEGTSFGLSILKGKDAINTIKYGEKPKENLVLGLDQAWVTNEIKLRVNTGIAYSIFTNDITGGSITKDQFDSSQRQEMPFDPYKYRKIQTINFSTTKPGNTAMSSYITIQFKPKNQVITGDFRYFGPGYQSFGNPFNRVDLRTFLLGDQIYMFKRKVNLTVRYTYQDNNRSGTAYATLRQNLFNSSMLIVPSVKWPQFMINYNLQSRKTFIPQVVENSSQFKTLQASDLLSTFTSTIYYSLNAFKCNHSFNVQYTLTDRTDRLFAQNSNQIYIYSAGFRENINPIHLALDIQYSRTDIQDVKLGRSPMTESYDAKLTWEWKKTKTRFQGGYQQSRMLYKLFTDQTARNSYSFGISNQSIKGLTIGLEYGYSPNRSITVPELNYDESYVIARLYYNLGLWLKR